MMLWSLHTWELGLFSSYRYYCHGVLQRLSSSPNITRKRGFIVTKQGLGEGVCRWKVPKGNNLGSGMILAKPTEQDFAEASLAYQVQCGWYRWRLWSHIEGSGFWLNWFSKILAKIGLLENWSMQDLFRFRGAWLKKFGWGENLCH